MHEKFMRAALEEAKIGVASGDGPPFGAVIARQGRYVVCAHNEIVKNRDPTAHSEMMAIRKACRVLDTTDLTGCVLYSSCEPCPMCLAACLTVNIEFIFYGASKEDARRAGYKSKDCEFYTSLAKNASTWKKTFLKQISCDEVNNLYSSDQHPKNDIL